MQVKLLSQEAPQAAQAAQAVVGRRGRETVGCLVLAFHSVNRKFRMSGLGEGSAHKVAGSPLVLCFLPLSAHGDHRGASEGAIAWAPPQTN